MFKVLLYSECDDSVYGESAPIQISASGDSDWGFHCWSPAHLSLDGYDLGYNHLILKFVIESEKGRVLVKSIQIPSGRLNYYHQVVPERKSSLREADLLRESLSKIRETKRSVLQVDSVEMTYIAYKYFDLDDCITPLGQVYFDTVTLSGFDLTPYLIRSGHKMTCLLNHMYLGRAQSYSDSIYQWKDDPTHFEEDAFDYLKEQADDLSLIRRADPSGLWKKRLFSAREHVPDNEAFSNPIRKLPMYLTVGESLRVQFFNFKFLPPRSVETLFKERDFQIPDPFVPSPRGLFRVRREATLPSIRFLHRTLLRGLVVRVMYTLEPGGKIRIASVRLHHEDKEILDMIEVQECKTV